MPVTSAGGAAIGGCVGCTEGVGAATGAGTGACVGAGACVGVGAGRRYVGVGVEVAATGVAVGVGLAEWLGAAVGLAEWLGAAVGLGRVIEERHPHRQSCGECLICRLGKAIEGWGGSGSGLETLLLVARIGSETGCVEAGVMIQVPNPRVNPTASTTAVMTRGRARLGNRRV